MYILLFFFVKGTSRCFDQFLEAQTSEILELATKEQAIKCKKKEEKINQNHILFTMSMCANCLSSGFDFSNKAAD